MQEYFDSQMIGRHPAAVSWHSFFVNAYFRVIERAIAEEPFPWRPDVLHVSLLDTFEAWLMQDEGVAVCGTFENYLVIACTILERYANRELLVACPGPGAADEDLRITPVEKGQETLKIRLSGLFDRHSDWRNMRVLNDLRYCHNASSRHDAHRHPALGRTTWEFAVRAYTRRISEDVTDNP